MKMNKTLMYKNMNEIINMNNEMNDMYPNMNKHECISENEWHVCICIRI